MPPKYWIKKALEELNIIVIGILADNKLIKKQIKFCIVTLNLRPRILKIDWRILKILLEMKIT